MPFKDTQHWLEKKILDLSKLNSPQMIWENSEPLLKLFQLLLFSLGGPKMFKISSVLLLSLMLDFGWQHLLENYCAVCLRTASSISLQRNSCLKT